MILQPTVDVVNQVDGNSTGFEEFLDLRGPVSNRSVEDGRPVELSRQPDSRYGAMLEAETWVQAEFWGSHVWRNLWMEDGRLNKDASQETTA